MRIGHKSSSEIKGCVVCQKKTAQYKTYEQSGMEVSIPACDEHFDAVDVTRATAHFLTGVKKDIHDAAHR